MANLDIETPKRRGRPRSGQCPGVSLRLDPELQDAIDRWRRFRDAQGLVAPVARDATCNSTAPRLDWYASLV